MNRRVLAAAALPGLCAIALLISSCTSSPPPSPTPSPTPTPTPTPTLPYPQMGGRWVGTLESPRFATRTVTMLITQTADCVDAGWQTDPAEWAGAISGFAQPGRF